MSSEDAGVNDDSGGNDEETRTTEASPVVPTQPPAQGIEVPKQNDDIGGQSTAPLATESILSITTTEVNRGGDAELEVTDDPKSAMDDLD
jgi:hypothetical protein